MARTRPGRRGNWYSNGSDWRSWKQKSKTKKKKSKKSSSRARSWMPYVSNDDINFISGFVGRGLNTYPYAAEEIIIDDDIPHDELDDEVMIGTIRTDIVGVQYYKGSVNNGEMVCLEREPNNAYDKNAVRVLNLDKVQVGHLKRDMAKPLSYVLDNKMARFEGTVPFGANNMYKISVDLTLWGQPEQKQRTIDVLRSHGVTFKPAPTSSAGSAASTSSSMAFAMRAGGGGAGSSYDYSHVISRREFLSPADVKNELDKLFESLQEGDKTTMLDAAKAIKSPLYPHQKQALNWMISRENGEHLPPFWEKKNNRYFNSLTVYTSANKPNSVKGGILADDMGLGKTLEMISLILTNFVDKQPLAQPVPGKVRISKKKSSHQRQKSGDSCKAGSSSKMTVPKEPTCPFEKIRAIEAEIDSLDDEKENGPLKAESCKPAKDVRDTLEEISNTPGLQGVKKIKLSKLNDSNFVTHDDSIEVIDSIVLSDENDDEDVEEEEEEEDDGGVCEVVGKDVMLQKEDKEFTPVVDVSNVSGRSSRPRRSAKRPARYTFSDSEDDSGTKNKVVETKQIEEKSVTTIAVPEKNPVTTIAVFEKPPLAEILVPEKPQGKARGRGRGGARGRARGRGRGKGVGRGKGKGKAKAGKIQNVDPSVIEIPDDTPPLPQLDIDELPDVSEVTETHSRDGEYVPDDSDSSSDDDLPDLDHVEIPFQCNEAGLSNCDLSTGRTKTDGARATLIVCPLSVMSNWVDQLEEHLHDNVHLEIYSYYGSNRKKNVNVLSQQDIVLTTYSTLAADAKTPQRPLQKVNWLRVVLDEGHMIRNPKAQQTKAIVDLKAERRWVLTGTPIQNSMKDLWSLINFLQINPLTERMWWHRTIERPLGHGDKAAIKRVQHLMGNIALRRTKTTKVNGKPLVELPARNVFIERIQLSEEERKVYMAMQNEGRLIISKYFAEGTLLHNYGQVLAILMRLRQMCCHPSLVARAAAAARETQALLEQVGSPNLCDDARKKLVETLLMVLNSGSDEECSICLDSLKAPVITPCAHVFCRPCICAVITNEQPNPHCPLCRGNIAEDRLIDVPPESEEETPQVFNVKDWQSSAKVDALMQALVKLREEDPTVKSLVVSQFTSFLTLIELPLRANGFHFTRLDGTMSAGKRTAAIEDFMSGRPNSPTIFLLSLKAGGVGLNLTAASRVFLMDPAWNPASEDQCFDRCHRLGQKRDVTITKFLVEDTVEERMLQLQENKRMLMQGAFGKKPTAEQQRQSRIKDIKNLINL